MFTKSTPEPFVESTSRSTLSSQCGSTGNVKWLREALVLGRCSVHKTTLEKRPPNIFFPGPNLDSLISCHNTFPKFDGILILPIPPPPSLTPTSGSGRWTTEEHDNFLVGLRVCGKDWPAVARRFVTSRTILQVRTHPRKYLIKMEKGQSFPKQVCVWFWTKVSCRIRKE